MSRSCYSDDYGDDFPGQMELYRANVERSIKSKAGQARLKELREALVALPVKELAFGTFVSGTAAEPKACALGAWALWKLGNIDAAHELVPRDGDDHDTHAALEPFGWPKLVVFDAVFMNDEHCRGETPAERYRRVLVWVERHIETTA